MLTITETKLSPAELEEIDDYDDCDDDYLVGYEDDFTRDRYRDPDTKLLGWVKESDCETALLRNFRTGEYFFAQRPYTFQEFYVATVTDEEACTALRHPDFSTSRSARAEDK